LAYCEFVIIVGKPRYARQTRVIESCRVDAHTRKIRSKILSGVGPPAIDVRVDVQFALLNNQRVVSDAYWYGAPQVDNQPVLAIQRVLNLFRGDRSGCSGNNLFGKIDQVSLLHSNASVRDQVPDILGLFCLVDQVAVTERDLDLAQRVPRVARRDMLTRRYLRIFDDPRTVRRHPFRVENDLPDLTVAYVYRKVLTANSDFV